MSDCGAGDSPVLAELDANMVICKAFPVLACVSACVFDIAEWCMICIRSVMQEATVAEICFEFRSVRAGMYM